ncbi:MAG: hypothetical protein Q7S37_04035 [bacterium]|nr:hypothetical protein [bacterium]
MESSGLRRKRHEGVPGALDQIVADHEAAASDFRELADYRRELLPDLQCRKLVFVCCDERYDVNEVLGYAPGIYTIVKTAGPMRNMEAFAWEVNRELEIAQSLAQSLWVLDLSVHDDCGGVDYDISLARTLQDQHERTMQQFLPKVFYTRGELVGDTADLMVIGQGEIGSESRVTFCCTDGADAVPEQHVDSEAMALMYVSQALTRTEAFDRMLCYPLAQVLWENLNHKMRCDRMVLPEHSARVGAVGAGLNWRCDSMFSVTARLDNEHIFEDVEHSILIGIGLMNEVVEQHKPIVWVCCQTYDEQRYEKEPKCQAKKEAFELMDRVRALSGLDRWIEDGRVVLVPGMLEKNSSTLTLVGECAIMD